MASSVKIKLTIRGQGGHGSTPDKLRDPITAAAFVLTSLHTIQSRSINAFEDFVLTICHVDAGSTYNVFPDEAVMLGTIRVYNEAVKEKVIERIGEIAESVAKAHGCKAELESLQGYPVLVNCPAETQSVLKVAREQFGEEWSAVLGNPRAGAEDFSYFLQHRPGAFFFLGTGKPGTQLMTNHHSKMDFNDHVLATGGFFWLKLLEERFALQLI